MTNLLLTNAFMKELNDTYFNDEDSEDKTCPINCLPFDENAITLPCSHKFNYVSLYEYIYSIKKVNNRYNTCRLKINEIQCPMCRNISNKLLPHIPNIYKECVEINNNSPKTRIFGVNSPQKFCMPHKTCDYVIMRGKKKGCACGNNAYHTKDGNLCEKHHNIILKNTKLSNNIEASGSLFDKIKKRYTVVQLKNLLRDNKLMVSGNKYVLIERIMENNILEGF